MYKTVRQGENSLQYTILPQTEEVLSNSGVKGKGRDYTELVDDEKMKVKLIFFAIMIGSITTLTFVGLGSALFWSGIIPSQFASKSDQGKFILKPFNYTATHSTLSAERSLTRKKELAHDLKITPDVSVNSNFTVIPLNKSSIQIEDNDTNTENYTDTSTTVVTQASVMTTTNIPLTSVKQWILPALKRLQSSTTVAPSLSTVTDKTTTESVMFKKLTSPYSHQRESNTDLMLRRDPINWTDYEDDDDDEYDTTKTLTTKVTITQNMMPVVNSNLKSTVISTVLQTVTQNTTIENGNLVLNKTVKMDNRTVKNKTKVDSARFMEMKEHILDDDDEDYKDLLTDESDVSEPTGSDDVKMSQAKSSWLQTRWPFVDPSSYFQWTDYSARDNLLLPAILSAAFSALLVLAVLCYALRRRQHCKRRIQEIGNLTSDLQAEDNAILLTAENPSEED